MDMESSKVQLDGVKLEEETAKVEMDSVKLEEEELDSVKLEEEELDSVKLEKSDNSSSSNTMLTLSVYTPKSCMTSSKVFLVFYLWII
ncbi:unnamed protein product [Urochloa humidicola]